MKRLPIIILIISTPSCNLFPELIGEGLSPEGDKISVYYHDESWKTHLIHVEVCLSKPKGGGCFKSDRHWVHNDGNIISKYDNRKVRRMIPKWTNEEVIFGFGESQVTYNFRQNKISSEVVRNY